MGKKSKSSRRPTKHTKNAQVEADAKIRQAEAQFDAVFRQAKADCLFAHVPDVHESDADAEKRELLLHIIREVEGGEAFFELVSMHPDVKAIGELVRMYHEVTIAKQDAAIAKLEAVVRQAEAKHDALLCQEQAAADYLKFLSETKKPVEDV